MYQHQSVRIVKSSNLEEIILSFASQEKYEKAYSVLQNVISRSTIENNESIMNGEKY